MLGQVKEVLSTMLYLMINGSIQLLHLLNLDSKIL